MSQKSSPNDSVWQPERIHESDKAQLNQFRMDPTVTVIDTLDEQVEELQQIRPQMQPWNGRWLYYPWKRTLVHLLDADNLQLVRTARNQLLMTPDEQVSFYNARIAIAGLNVGNPAAICLALEGGSQFMKLADFDTLSLSNLNRFRAGVTELGRNKAVLSAQQIYETNPDAELEVWPSGIKPAQISPFLTNIDLLIEETDSLPLKIALRQQAKLQRLPVVMVTGNGSGVILDIERYDLEADLPILNGYLLPTVMAKIAAVTATTPATEKVLLARDFMGKQFLTQRLNESFLKVGTELAGIPQLAEASFLRGAVVCYAVRQILTGTMASGRYIISQENLANTRLDSK